MIQVRNGGGGEKLSDSGSPLKIEATSSAERLDIVHERETCFDPRNCRNSPSICCDELSFLTFGGGLGVRDGDRGRDGNQPFGFGHKNLKCPLCI